MARNTKAKKKKAPKPSTKKQLEMLLAQYSKEIGETIYIFTESEVKEIKREAINTAVKGSTSLLEYNMILENHLTPKQAKEQSKLMDIRADAIARGDLTWEEVNAFLEEHYEKEEQKRMVTLKIDGTLPGLNQYILACRSNRYAGAQMKKDTEKKISLYIMQQLKGVHIDGTVKLTFRWYEPNKRRDLDNISFAKKFLLDALVSNGIIDADGWRGVIGFTDEFFLDKENPRIEVDIEKAVNPNG